MKDFITGVEEKYDKRLLEGRLTAEGNVIALLFADPLLLDELELTSKDFITKDGTFYFALAKQLRKAGYSVFDEVTILSSISDNILDAFNERGGYETIKNMVDVVNSKNADVYIDTLYKENIMLNLYRDGFNLFNPVDWNGKEIIPYELFKKMDSEGVTDWYESKIIGYNVGQSSSIIEEEDIDFDDEFIKSCLEGDETGVPFETGGIDVNGEPINCYPFLSKQISGLPRGTLSMIGGFSSAGKSTWLVGLMIALMNSGEKIVLVSNEERVKKYKVKLITWLLAKRNRYYNLTKKKIFAGQFTAEDMKQVKDVQNFWRDNYKSKLRIVVTNDADIKIAKKKIREAALKDGYSTFIVDTFKINEADMTASRTDLCLVKDSRELAKIAQRLDMIGFASVQLAERDRGKIFLDSSVLSNSKQIKEILENLFLIRSVYDEELDSNDKLYCRPFRLKKINDKWVEEEYTPDRSAVWRMLFVEKNRNGDNSSDTGRAYLLRFAGDYAVFRETCQCRPRHKRIE